MPVRWNFHSRTTSLQMKEIEADSALDLAAICCHFNVVPRNVWSGVWKQTCILLPLVFTEISTSLFQHPTCHTIHVRVKFVFRAHFNFWTPDPPSNKPDANRRTGWKLQQVKTIRRFFQLQAFSSCPLYCTWHSKLLFNTFFYIFYIEFLRLFVKLLMKLN